MRGAIALGRVKGASCRAQAVRAPSTVKRCPTPPSPRSRGCCVVFVVVYGFLFAFWGEASKGRITYVLSQQCGVQARTLRRQDAGKIGTLHTDKAQTMGTRARTEHTMSAGLWHDLHLGFD